MQSRGKLRRTLAALMVGILIGGGVLAVTPAGAQVAEAAATNWKKIWKKKLQPLADKRYYKKTQSDAKYQTKAGTLALLGNYFTKAETDAKLGNYYTKAQSDAKYAPFPTVIRGTTMQGILAAGAGDHAGDNISFGVTLSAAPTPNYIPIGAPVPPGCSGGTPASPNAAPGNLCVFEVFSSNNTGNNLVQPSGALGTTPMGAVLFASSAAAGQMVITTTWAVRPVALAPATATLKQSTPSGESLFRN